MLLNKILKNYSVSSIQVRTSILYIICSVFQKGTAFIVVPIYTRMVSAEQYGKYSIYQSWEMVLAIFATLNMWNYLFNNGMIKYKNKKDEFTSALMGLSNTITLLVFCFFLFFSEFLTRWIGISLGIMCIMFVEFLFRSGYEYWCSRKRIEYDINGYLFSTLVMTVLTPLTSIGLIYYFRFAIISHVGNALILGKVLIAILVYIIICIKLRLKSNKFYDREIWGFALRFSLPLIPHFLAGVILQQSDRIMISKLCGSDSAGIYSVAYSCAFTLQIVNAAFLNCLIPWLYNSLENKDYKRLPQIARVSLIVIAGLNIIIAICAPEFIKIMAPKEYQAAIYIVPPVAISNVLMYLYSLFATVEYYYEETKKVASASIFSAVANIMLNYIFIKKYGYIAAGYTTVACYLLHSIFHFLFMRIVLKKRDINTDIYTCKWLWLIAFAAIILSIVTIFIYPYPIIRLLIVLTAVLILLYKRNIIITLLKRKEPKHENSSFNTN